MNQLKISTPTDWCTYARAAEILGVSLRQVGRLVANPNVQLHAITPQVGARESARGKRVLSVDDVLALRDALKVTGRG